MTMVLTVQARGQSPEQLTELNLDKSPLLRTLVADSFGGQPSELVAELQVRCACLELPGTFR